MMKQILILLFLLPFFVFAKANTVIYNITDNQVIDGSLDNNMVSIASISKLMTVYTVLKENQDLHEKLTVVDKKVTNTRISKGMVLTRIDLINLALISSDNLAAQTLSNNFPGGRENFIRTMNQNAIELNMRNSGFVEPTGLSPMNYSTVSDIVLLTQAVSQFNIVQEAAHSQKVITETTITTITKKSKKKKETVVQGNPTSKYFGKQGIITIKTGFTNAAGFCITMLVNANNKLYNITILGAKTKQERQKFIEKSLSTIFNA